MTALLHDFFRAILAFFSPVASMVAPGVLPVWDVLIKEAVPAASVGAYKRRAALDRLRVTAAIAAVRQAIAEEAPNGR
jgi:hypothetical protein